jgi:hypothetical protein
MEQWKDVLDLEEYYEVSDLGNVRSKVRKWKSTLGLREYGGKPITPFLSTVGYPAVNLTTPSYRKQYHVHRLVLEAFLGKPKKGLECCHNNGIKTDCRLDNLRWDTKKNNHRDQKIHGTKYKGSTKITLELALEIRNLDEKVKNICEKYGLSRTQIWRIKNNKAWYVQKQEVA